ncbi:PREDICTED: protein C9orf69 homolog [Myotis brandtii]|nr:PREDICTED: protein C9orf69 homolog [Myotis brandtii]
MACSGNDRRSDLLAGSQEMVCSRGKQVHEVFPVGERLITSPREPGVQHGASGPLRTSRLARTKYNNFDVYVRARWLYGFIRFLLYFSCSLFTAALWGALAALFCLQYLGVRVLLRFQLKLSVLLLLLGRRRVDFRLLNELMVYGIHVTLLLVGGLGWCFMVFVDM